MKKHAKKIVIALLTIAMLIPTVAMIFTNAAITDYPVELAFNNIFVFDKWSNNTLSTTIVSGGGPVSDKLELNMEEGSVKFENPYSAEAYTGHGMGQGAIDSAGNFQYYMMDVEPGATYTFSYNLTSLTSGLGFTPYIFFFDETGSYITLQFDQVTASGEVEFIFTAPTNAHYIQTRFTISGTGTAEFEEIAIRKTEVYYSNSIFSFSDWASNSKSSIVCDLTEFLGTSVTYDAGTVSKNTTENSVTLTTNSEAATKGVLFTNFGYTSGDGYYMMPVEAGSIYSLSYNLASCDFATTAYSTYIIFYGSDKNYQSFTNFSAANTGENKFEFTAPDGAAYIQIMFGIAGITESGKSCTIKDVAINKASISGDASAGVSHRLVYTYKGDETTYGELPVPTTTPTGYVFAGWYTGINGTGELITENTPVSFTSYTVYPKYEPIVNSISIKTMPVKTEYTVGERVNPTGLVLEATVANLTTTIESGYRCTPEYLTSVGTQVITVHYGGKTATYTVNVSASASNSIVVNGSNVDVSVTNNVYTFASTVSTGEFNRYVITYNSDAYFEGIITYSDGVTEQFFLEPSSNFAAGETSKFTSFVDGYLEKVIDGAGQTTAINSHTRSGITSIAFTPLDNKAGSIDLLSITTSKSTQITSAAETIKSFSDDKFKVEVDILNGGVVSGIYALNSNVVARVYEHKDTEGNITYETLVDYKENLSDIGYISESTNVNLINIYDNGRYLQQSYYGTIEKPYEASYYNSADWSYNPVQGGNVANEASKVIDYEIGDNYIYVKTRPLDWAKWSDDHAADCTHPTEDHTEAKWGDEYITDTYVEAKYVFEDGIIKTYCRMVDYSGLPSAQTTQELPAFYTIEPLNNFVYNDVSKDEAWVIQNFKYNESPEFWGITQDYINTYYSNGGFDPNADVNEHWAAFMASESSNSFGIGLYTPETTNFYYGCYPAIYSGVESRHADTVNPATEDNTSYIAPVGVKTFESYKPTEYMYSLTTGTVKNIQDTFGLIYDEGYEAELERVQIGVPETIYMTPNAGQSTTGQYFVNNHVDAEGKLIADAVNNATKGIISVYAPGSTAIKFDVSAVNGGIGDPVIGGGTVDSTYENQRWNHSLIYDAYGTGAAQDWFEFNQLGLAINGTGVSEGGTALLEWEITVYYGDSDTTGETHYAYTTLYSPWLEPVGAAIRSVTRGDTVYDQAAAWVSGVHGYTANSSGTYKVAVTDQTLNNDGNFVGDYYAKTESYALVPLLYGIGEPSNTTTGIASFIQNSSPGGGITSPTFRYTNRQSNSGNYGILVSELSPVANITVDTSRYSNFNQIPNLTVGYNITDIENSKGVIWYVSDLTDVINSATDATTHEVKFYNYTYSGSSSDTMNKALNEWFDGKAVGNLIYGSDTENCGTNYNAVSTGAEWNAAWDRSIITGSETYDYMFKGVTHAHANSSARAYALNHVQVRATNVNKTNLRDLVVLASGLDETNYTSASWSALKTVLQNAALELGNPTDYDISTAEEELKNKLMALQTPVTLNANGGSFSGGATTTTVNLTCGPALAPSYTIPVENNPTLAGYTVEGWSTDSNATEGTNPVTGSLKPTFYAIWTEGNYTIIYNANGGAGYIADVTLKHSESVQLATLGFTREGYSLVGWAKSSTATSPDYLLGQTVSGLSNNTETTVTLYAVWLESRYTIVYNANGGTGSIANQTVDINASVTLASSGFTRDGYNLLGWATNASVSVPEYQLGQTVSQLAAGGTITLYAVWELADLNVTFDNLIDFNAWNKTSNNGVVSDITSTGFTLTSNDGVGEATSSSPYFAVEPGKSYKIDIDITGDAWDVYIFFCNENGSWVDFVDGPNGRYSSAVFSGMHTDHVFTAPDKTEVVKAQIRVDANGSNNTVSFDNIRVYEYSRGEIDVSPVNKYVVNGNAFGTLPTPTRAGYTFLGWYDGDTLVTAESTVTQTSTIYLTSKWQLANTALTADTAVIDFSTPITIDAVANDTIFTDAATTYGATSSIIGISTDNTNFAATAAGNYGTFKLENGKIIYTPDTVVDGEEKTVYYKAQLSSGDTTVLTNSITVVPASNVLYEENIFTSATTDSGVDWKAPEGTSASTVSQAASTSTDVYGYDSNTDGYNRIANYSNGSALAVNVDATNKRSEIISFTFNGTGFDLNGVCGPTTGIQVVTLRDNNYVDENGDVVGKMVKSYIVDTYYSDLDDESISRYGETLYQVPIIAENGLNHSNYTVQIVASWLPSMSGAVNASELSTQAVDGMTVNTAPANDAALREALADIGLEYVLDAEDVDVVWFDDDSVLNGGEGVNTVEEDVLSTQALTSLLNVVDSVRVYNPIYGGSSQYIASEQNAEYYNVIDNLVNVKDGNIITAGSANFAYVSGNDAEEISIDTYDQIGPKDELYLAGSSTSSNAVTFTVNGFDADAMKVMISLRAASGTPVAKIGGYSFDVLSNTEMYYDITEYIADDGTVTIQNMKDKTLLSVGSLKITSEVLATASLSTEFNLMSARAMMSAPAVNVEPNAPLVEPEEPAAPEEPAEPEEPSENDSTIKSRIEKIINRILEKYSWFFKLIKIVLGL